MKYGITKRADIGKRWKASLGYDVVYFVDMNSFDALALENHIKIEFQDRIYDTPKIKSKEVISQDFLNEVVSIILKHTLLEI